VKGLFKKVLKKLKSDKNEKVKRCLISESEHLIGLMEKILIDRSGAEKGYLVIGISDLFLFLLFFAGNYFGFCLLLN
jgi:hypothetical protein